MRTCRDCRHKPAITSFLNLVCLWDPPAACLVHQLLQNGVSAQSSLSASVASYTICYRQAVDKVFLGLL